MKHKHRLVPKPKPVQPAPSAKVAFPSPQERERIIERRDELMQKVIYSLVAGSGATPNRRMALLMQEYGPAEVKLTLEYIQRNAQERELLTEAATLYRQYRLTFARFGGRRRFLGQAEYEALTREYALAFGQRKFKLPTFLANSPGKRELELNDLLLKDEQIWDDIFPPEAPSRPADWSGPPAGVYTGPAQTVLQWGADLDDKRIARQAAKTSLWRPAIPELVRLALDDGLLEGWPGESASWAPFHALHLLGYLRAHEHARALLALAERQNDWLSDQLPLVWTRMGLPVEPVLWECLNDPSQPERKRRVALAGVQALVKAHPSHSSALVSKLIAQLRAATADDATMNGYIVNILNRLQATQAQDAIAEAFQQRRVDRKIMRPEDVSFL